MLCFCFILEWVIPQGYRKGKRFRTGKLLITLHSAITNYGIRANRLNLINLKKKKLKLGIGTK